MEKDVVSYSEAAKEYGKLQNLRVCKVVTVYENNGNCRNILCLSKYDLTAEAFKDMGFKDAEDLGFLYCSKYCGYYYSDDCLTVNEVSTLINCIEDSTMQVYVDCKGVTIGAVCRCNNDSYKVLVLSSSFSEDHVYSLYNTIFFPNNDDVRVLNAGKLIELSEIKSRERQKEKLRKQKEAEEKEAKRKQKEAEEEAKRKQKEAEILSRVYRFPREYNTYNTTLKVGDLKNLLNEYSDSKTRLIIDQQGCYVRGERFLPDTTNAASIGIIKGITSKGEHRRILYISNRKPERLYIKQSFDCNNFDIISLKDTTRDTISTNRLYELIKDIDDDYEVYVHDCPTRLAGVYSKVTYKGDTHRDLYLTCDSVGSSAIMNHIEYLKRKRREEESNRVIAYRKRLENIKFEELEVMEHLNMRYTRKIDRYLVETIEDIDFDEVESINSILSEFGF